VSTRTRRTAGARRLSPAFITYGSLALLLVGAITIGLQQAFGWLWLVTYLVGVNVATLVLYAIDKFNAVRGWLRVPERLLHLVTFLGGTPAALIGQQLLRHKTLKGSFRAAFWLLLVLQAALIGLWIWWRTRG
jgi:uncharacterized membrane protein YsdA (DUF1294 family)